MKGKGVGLMVAVGPKGEKPEEDEDEREADGVEVAAAERFASAIKSGNGAAIVRTYKRLKALCEASGEEY